MTGAWVGLRWSAIFVQHNTVFALRNKSAPSRRQSCLSAFPAPQAKDLALTGQYYKVQTWGENINDKDMTTAVDDMLCRLDIVPHLRWLKSPSVTTILLPQGFPL